MSESTVKQRIGNFVLLSKAYYNNSSINLIDIEKDGYIEICLEVVKIKLGKHGKA